MSRAEKLTAESLSAALTHWAADQYPNEAVLVSDVHPMPGNAGLSFGFDLRRDDGPPRGAVIRLAPPGVPRRGSADVLRQVPLLRALGPTDVPVATVRFDTDDPRWFGTDAFIVDLIAGSPLHLTDGSLSRDGDAAQVDDCVGQAVDALADLHGLPWKELLGEWMAPRSIEEEVDFWWRIAERVMSQDLRPEAGRLRRELLDRAPSRPPTGIVHGDFQTNNVLYENDRLTAILDWELAAIGPQLLDLGWLVMMTDRSMWAEPYASMLRFCVPVERLVERYAARSGRTVERIGWYQALACFRFAAIVAYNSLLHRTGKRPDVLYEALEPSIPRLIERGLESVDDPA